jgi:hypothetical protein
MKAPLLLGNDVRKMDAVALGVVKNKDALSISQDALGVQAQRVWTSGKRPGDLDPAAGSVAAVATPCDRSQPTQAWKDEGGILVTTDDRGIEWCLKDVHGTEEVGSWRAVPCNTALLASTGDGTALTFQRRSNIGSAGASATAVTLATPLGGRLAVNNAMGASGPVAHTRYLSTDQSRSSTASATWLREPVSSSGHEDDQPLFRLMAADRIGVRDDDKVGGVTIGGDFCLGLAADGDSEVWAGPLTDKKWAVALLNRNPTANATIALDYTMFNATADASFSLYDIWEGQAIGTHKGSFSTTVQPQSATYLILTPASGD